MRPAHPCSSCGIDLARVRARREPVYGLNLVTCPRCGAHAVRAHLDARRRLRRRAVVAVAALALPVAAALVLIPPHVAAAVFLADEWVELRDAMHIPLHRITIDRRTIDLRIAAIGASLVPAAAGVVLGAAYGPRRAAILAAHALALLLAAVALVAGAESLAGHSAQAPRLPALGIAVALMSTACAGGIALSPALRLVVDAGKTAGRRRRRTALRKQRLAS